MKAFGISSHINSRAGWVLALLALASFTALAQTTIKPQTGPFRIAGRVVNASTGEAVPRAMVSALAEDDNHVVESVQSDADGHFSLTSLPAGKYPLTASKRGYRTAFYDEHDEFNSAIVTGDGQETGDLVFQLTPGAVLRGVVTGDGGDAVDGASVMLFQRQHAGVPSKQVVEVDATTTDDRGAYEFANLAAGEYLLAVTASPWYALHKFGSVGSGEASPLDVAYPATFFDSTTDEASATPIELASGSREEANVNLHAVPALRLKLPTQRRQDSATVPRDLRQRMFGIQLNSESVSWVPGTNPTEQTPEFDGLAPGHYEMTIGDPPRILDLDATDSMDVDPNTGTPAMSVSGMLRVTGGGALPDEATVTIEPMDDVHGRPQMVTTAHKGQFRFDTVAPGVWSLSAESNGQVLPVVATASGGASSAGSQFTVKDRPVALQATVSRGGARVQGFARKNDKGVAGVMMVLVPKEPTAYHALARRDQSDSDGSFLLRDVPAGQYTVVAIEDGWKLGWQRRDVIGRYLPGGVAVTIREQTKAIVSLSAPVPVQPR